MKRLEKELAGVSNMDPEQITVRQKQNLFHWEVTIKGPAGSPYEGFNLIVDFDFPEQFPFKFPMLKFKTMIWHPNVKDGDICKEMVGQKQWQPNKKSLQSMLVQPDIHSAINLQAANQYKLGKFEAHAKQALKKQVQSKKKSEEKQEKVEETGGQKKVE